MTEKELNYMSADDFNEKLDDEKENSKKEIEQVIRNGSYTASVSEMDHRIAVQQSLDSIDTELTALRHILVKVLVAK